MLNEVLGVAARYQQLLTRKFGILGGAPSPQVTPEVTPSFDLATGPEDRILCSDVLATGATLCAAVAAKRSVIQLSNPTGSNSLVVVEKLSVEHGDASAREVVGAVGFNSALPQLPAAGGITTRETRRTRVIAGPICVKGVADLTYDQAPATILVANLFYLSLPANTPVWYDQAILLAPGWCVQVSCVTINISLYASFAWREIPLGAGEVGPF